MHRRAVLRRVGAGTAAAMTVGLAGCSGDDGSDEGTEDEGTPTPRTGESMGSVAENSVEGLRFVDWQSDDSDDEQFVVTLTVENTGDRETDAFEYSYELTLFDEDGTDITAGISGSSATGETTIAPGEETDVQAMSGVDGSPSDVARYEIALSCEGFGAEGAYCE